MDPLLISAASGMKSRMDALDLLANNIANSGTVGFKSDHEFYGLYEQQLPVVETQWTDFSQGAMTATGNPLNLALSGKGVFGLNSPTGTVFTRSGDFRISKNNELETSEGYTIRNILDKGNPITVDPTLAIDVSKDGVVSQAGQGVGQIEIDWPDSAPQTSRNASQALNNAPQTLDNPQALSKLGSSYFAMVDKRAPVARASDSTEVLQGQLEQSNVPVADAAVKLVGVMRQFEMLQKAMTLASDMSKQAIAEVAKVA
jgi:flagellar basal-body rod protein FlgF